MKKHGIHITAFWIGLLILLPHSSEGEMRTLTDQQMGEQYFKTWNFSLTANLLVEEDMPTEGDDLLRETEEDRLNRHIQGLILGRDLEASDDSEGSPNNEDPIRDPLSWRNRLIDLYLQLQDAKSDVD
jgi:hypothetical protein